MAKQIKIEDLLHFRFIENLSFSPSGRNYAYQLANVDQKKDDYFRTVYVNRKPFRSDRSTSILAWYDDERLIVSEESKNKKALYNKLLLLNTKDGKRRAFFSSPLNISSLKVVDANTVVFTAGIDANEPDLYKAKKEELEKYRDKMKKEAAYEVLDEIPYWFNGAGFLNKKRKALFVATLRPLNVQRITEPLFNADGFEIRDRKVFYLGNSYDRRAPMYKRIFSYDIDTGETAVLYDREDLLISDLFFLDGDYIADEDEFPL